MVGTSFHLASIYMLGFPGRCDVNGSEAFEIYGVCTECGDRSAAAVSHIGALVAHPSRLRKGSL